MSFQVDILVLATKDFHIDGANLQMKTNNASKIAIFLWQLYYSQIGFIILVPGVANVVNQARP